MLDNGLPIQRELEQKFIAASPATPKMIEPELKVGAHSAAGRLAGALDIRRAFSRVVAASSHCKAELRQFLAKAGTRQNTTTELLIACLKNTGVDADAHLVG